MDSCQAPYILLRLPSRRGDGTESLLLHVDLEESSQSTALGILLELAHVLDLDAGARAKDVWILLTQTARSVLQVADGYSHGQHDFGTLHAALSLRSTDSAANGSQLAVDTLGCAAAQPNFDLVAAIFLAARQHGVVVESFSRPNTLQEDNFGLRFVWELLRQVHSLTRTGLRQTQLT